MMLWHNPNCSKSRAAFEALDEKDIKFTSREYLKDIPSKDELIEVINLLNLNSPKDIMRTKEDKYTELNLLDENTSNDTLLQAMINFPILIERPIAINNGKAAIGRPLENILEII
jgi:arsenate reductase